MAKIEKELKAILDAEYGEEVRGSIHDAIKKGNDEINLYGIREEERAKAESDRAEAEASREEAELNRQKIAKEAADAANEAAKAAGAYVLGDISDKTVTFSQAASLANVQSGDSMAAALAKLAKLYSALEGGAMNYWSLSGGTVIPANSNLNDYKTPGNYSVGTNANAKTILNSPIDVAFVMKVYYATGTASYPAQEIVAFNTGRRYRRYFTGGDPNNNWTSWILLDKPTANNLDTTADGYSLDARVGPVITNMIGAKQDLLAKGSQITNIDEFTLGVAWMNFGSGSISGTKPYDTGYGYVLAFQSSGASYMQIVISYSGVSLKYRTHVNGEWQTWKSLVDSTLLKAYPVGSIYMSVNSTNPGTLFGGTWEAWGSGRVPVGVNTSDTSFDTVEKTGGNKTITLTSSQIPSHNHGLSQIYVAGEETGSTIAYTAGFTQKGVRSITAATDYTGGGSSHSNLQPYITCYMWKRTA